MRPQYYTSIEQSKHLLELGLNPETADMTYNDFSSNECISYSNPRATLTPWKQIASNLEYLTKGGYIYNPCWSIGALLETMPLIKEDNLVLRKNHEDRTFVLQNDAYCTPRCKSPIDAAYEMMVWLLENKEILTTEEEKRLV